MVPDSTGKVRPKDTSKMGAGRRECGLTASGVKWVARHDRDGFGLEPDSEMLEQYPAPFFLRGQGDLVAMAVASHDQVHF
jgi:hypothetical protein